MSVLPGIGRLLLAAMALVAPAADPQPVDVGAIEQLVTERVAAAGLPGAAVVVTEGTRVLYLHGFGHDSRGAPITGDTPFRVASVSKSFTSLAVLQLADVGRVRLDEPVRTYLPDFVTADPRSDRITVRQLLDQTSGMADGGFPEVSLPQPGTVREAVARLRAARLVADPGTAWNYHNPNYQVAARLVEVVSGEPFGDYLRRHVFGPLGMAHSTSTATDDEPVPGLADGHSFVYGAALALPGPGYFVAGSGGVVTTAADMGRWLVAQGNSGLAADGTRIASAGAIAAAHTPSAPGGYALGWDTDGPPDRSSRITHSGCCFAWAATQALLPGRGRGVAVLFDSATPLGADEAGIAEGVIAIAEGRVPQPAGPWMSIVDLVLAALTLVVVVLGVRGLVRSRRWAARRASRPLWRSVLRLLPHTVVGAVCLAFPTLAGFLFGGRDVAWFSAAYNWPALVVLVTAVALAEVAVVLTRVGTLVTRSPAPTDGAGRAEARR